MGCATSRNDSSIDRNQRKQRFAIEVIPPSEIDMKNDWLAMKIENNPNDLFIQRNIKDCFKKDKERIPHKLMQSKPQRVLKSLEYISQMSKKLSQTSEGTKTNEPVDY